MIKLSPSILSADFANLQRDIAIAVDAGAEYVHVDCMDGHFVPNLTIGAPVVKALRKATDATLDVHLMISNPDQYLDDFIKAGSDIITVHYEANGDTLAQVRKIKEAGVRACVSIKPGTPADVLLPLLPELDMVLIMTVEPVVIFFYKPCDFFLQAFHIFLHQCKCLRVKLLFLCIV